VSSLWYLDSSQELEANNCYITRSKYIGNSQTVELYGRLHADFFNSNKMWINDVDMNFKLTRTTEAFNFLAPTDDKIANQNVIRYSLYHSIRIETPRLLAHLNVLAMKRKTHYPLSIIRSKLLQRFLELSKSLYVMHSLGWSLTGFL